jgi:uncharacterized membrane protein
VTNIVEVSVEEKKPATRSRLPKTIVLTVIVILTQVIGDYFLTRGMRQVGSIVAQPPSAYITALMNPLVALGVALLITWLFSHMVLLSWADLSFVLPVTSIGYVLIALTGRVFLNETVSLTRWCGIALIVTGVMLVGQTPPSTSPRRPAQ